MSFLIGKYEIEVLIVLVFMFGVIDLLFWCQVQVFGVGVVVFEMVVSDVFVVGCWDMVCKVVSDVSFDLCIIQLVGCEVYWMLEGVKIVEDVGVDVVDINMGCLVCQVIKGLLGFVLMCDFDYVMILIEVIVVVMWFLVILKMCLGWDYVSFNVAELV